MSTFREEQKDLVVEGMTEQRLESADVEQFGRLSASETLSPARVAGRSVLMGPLPFLLSACTPAKVPQRIAGTCTGQGVIQPTDRVRVDSSLPLLRVGDTGTCQGTCLVQQGSATALWHPTCQLKIVAAGQTDTPAAGRVAAKVARQPKVVRRRRRLRLPMTLCSVSWISSLNVLQENWLLAKDLLSRFVPISRLGNSIWLVKTALALHCTANETPPPVLLDRRRDGLETVAAFRGRKEYRAMAYVKLTVELDLDRDAVVSVKQEDGFTDGGWTPPFNRQECPAGWLEEATDERDPQVGDHSPLSGVQRWPRRHPNSSFTGIKGQPIANLLVKCRAGKHTDDLGQTLARTPFHVPWVWCETLVTYDHGQFRLHGIGSTFPSHAWYVNTHQVGVQLQAGDSYFPLKRDAQGQELDLERVKLYHVLRAGLPSTVLQSVAEEDDQQTCNIRTHPHTVAACAYPFEFEWLAE